MFSGVAASAAMTRSPSFSRSSSSTTTAMPSRPMASMASCTFENAIRPPPPLEDPLPAARPTPSCPLHTSPIVPAPGPAKSGRPSSPPKKRRRQVQDVAVHQPGGVEVVGHGGPALDQQLEHAAAAQLVSTSARSPESSRAGCTLAPAGARPSTTRRGCGRSTAVVEADRQLGVVGPHRARPDQDGIGARPAGGGRRGGPPRPVIQRLVPSGAAVRPSRLAAILRTTQGCPVVRCLR